VLADVGGAWWPAEAPRLTDSEIKCVNCFRLVKLKIFSAGFMDVIAFTCDRDSTVLTISLYDKKLDALLGRYSNTAWTKEQFRTVEANLIACPCGGSFMHNAQPKCPNCRAILRSDRLGSSEFVVVGKWIDGEKTNPWRS